MKKFLYTVSILLSTFILNAQITFQKTYGGIGDDIGYSIQQTLDLGYIITGYTSGFGAGGKDVCLVKTDANGNVVWNKTFGGVNDDWAQSLLLTSDSGFIMAGTTFSSASGLSNFYVIKTNSFGDTSFVRSFGGVLEDYSYEVQEIIGTGYIIFGSKNDPGPNGEGVEMHAVKIDYNGNIIGASITLGTNGSNSSNYDIARSGIILDDSHYVFLGTTNKSGNENIELVYLNAGVPLASNLWCIGGPDVDKGNKIIKTTDGGYLIAGSTKSFGSGNEDIYLIRLNSSFVIQWAKAYGGMGIDIGNSVRQTFDGGYVTVGSTTSFGAGYSDIFILKTDSNGNSIWTKTYGGANDDYGYSIQQTLDSGFAIVGRTESFDADSSDIYFIKTDKFGNIECNLSSIQFDSTSSILNQTLFPWNIGFFGGTVLFSATEINQLVIPEKNLVCVNTSNDSLPNDSIHHVTMDLFPNPTNSSFTILIDDTLLAHNAQLRIIDATGREVFSLILVSNMTTINRHLSSGIYFVKVADGKNYYCSKIIVY